MQIGPLARCTVAKQFVRSKYTEISVFRSPVCTTLLHRRGPGTRWDSPTGGHAAGKQHPYHSAFLRLPEPVSGRWPQSFRHAVSGMRCGGRRCRGGGRPYFSGERRHGSCRILPIFTEDRMRLGKGKTENSVFLCLCARLSLSLQKTGCGSAKAKPKTPFSFASALAFHYLCGIVKRKGYGYSSYRRTPQCG